MREPSVEIVERFDDDVTHEAGLTRGMCEPSAEIVERFDDACSTKRG
ncbi:hypothetical protein [Burkholderia lata]|nr:hypothetical protein [Burkholderia lata]